MKYISVFLIWLLFVAVQPVAFLTALLSLLGGTSAYASNILRVQDKATAAFLGWSGERTVSKECEESDCRFCKILCAILNVILQPDHCKKQ